MMLLLPWFWLKDLKECSKGQPMKLVFVYINMSLATKCVMVIPKPIVKSIIVFGVSMLCGNIYMINATYQL